MYKSPMLEYFSVWSRTNPLIVTFSYMYLSVREKDSNMETNFRIFFYQSSKTRACRYILSSSITLWTIIDYNFLENCILSYGYNESPRFLLQTLNNHLTDPISWAILQIKYGVKSLHLLWDNLWCFWRGQSAAWVWRFLVLRLIASSETRQALLHDSLIFSVLHTWSDYSCS